MSKLDEMDKLTVEDWFCMFFAVGCVASGLLWAGFTLYQLI